MRIRELSLAVVPALAAVLLVNPLASQAGDKATGKYETKTKLTTKLAGSGTQKSKFTETFKVSSKKVNGKASGANGTITTEGEFKLKLEDKAETGGKIKATGDFIDRATDSATNTTFKNKFEVTSASFTFKSNRKGDLQMKGKAKAKGFGDIGAGPQKTTIKATFRGKD